MPLEIEHSINHDKTIDSLFKQSRFDVKKGLLRCNLCHGPKLGLMVYGQPIAHGNPVVMDIQNPWMKRINLGKL